jgi:hypothetical protein
LFLARLKPARFTPAPVSFAVIGPPLEYRTAAPLELTTAAKTREMTKRGFINKKIRRTLKIDS